MRGLFEKDLRLTLARKQTLLIFIVMALIMGAAMDGTFLVGYLTMLGSILAVGTISYDEFDNGFAFLMTLPFERKTYVREKYLFSLFMEAASWCAGALIYCLGSLVRSSGDPVRDLPMLLSLIPVLFLSVSVFIPLVLKYGSEKSRVALYLVFGVMALIALGAKQVMSGREASFAGLEKTLEAMSPAVVLLILTAVCGILSFISYLCSVRIMEKKEF
jgi:hypothetical protein